MTIREAHTALNKALDALSPSLNDLINDVPEAIADDERCDALKHAYYSYCQGMSDAAMALEPHDGEPRPMWLDDHQIVSVIVGYFAELARG